MLSGFIFLLVATLENFMMLDIFMTSFLKVRILFLSSGLASIAVLASFAQTGSAQASSDPSRCTSSSRQATVACCEQVYGNHPPTQHGRRNPTCARAVICKISLIPLMKVAFPQRCSIDPLMKGNDKGKGLKLT
jgi:hypothetical protein